MRRRLWAALTAHAALAAACAPGSMGPPNPNTGSPPGDPPAVPVAHERELRGSRLHDVAIAGTTEVASMDVARLVAATRADLRGRMGAIEPSEFTELHRSRSALRGGAQLQTVVARQTVGGVPIDDTYLYAAVRHDARGARLVGSSYHLFENVALDLTPALSRDRAIALAQAGLRLRRQATPRAADLVVHRLSGRLQLAWRVAFPDTYERAFVIASGSELGRVHAIDARIYETTGTVTGPVVHGGAPGGLGVAEVSPLPNVRVVAGALEVAADGDGRYAITVPDGSLVTATLAGRAANVTDLAGAPLHASALAIADRVTDLAMAATAEAGLAQSTAYAIVDQVRSFLEANGMDPAVLGPPLATHTNMNATCNAFYDSGGRSVNFFRSGGGCNNSAIDTVIAHEYGHFIDDANGGILDAGLSEGWGDLLTCLWSKQPVIGFDLHPGQELRSCQNDYVYPPSGADEVHLLGQAWQGFGWDVRQNLVAALGPSGDDLARSLILPAFQSNAPDIPTAVLEVFLRDDDDGDLANHTPHWDQLFPAAVHHGLAFVTEFDVTPPAPVTDLAVSRAQLAQLDVTWTATGDDRNEGVAAVYQLRWATFPITTDNFAAANLVATGAPNPAGSPETASFAVPPGTTVFVALIARDERGNTSHLSNVVSVTTPAGTEVLAESAEADTSAWSTTGLWHVTSRRATDGSHAFWYGQEDTGNYSTGVTNSGDLISPVIDLSGIGSPVLLFDQFLDVEPNPFDLAEVIVGDVEDPSHTLILDKDLFSSGGAFMPRLLPLTGFAGKKLRLRFHFDTVDSVANATEGWYIDHLRVVGVAATGCAHELCTMGAPLDPSCSSCVASACAFDGRCATADACDSCAARVCGTDPYCCTTEWDSRCVQEAVSGCGVTCSVCSHSLCSQGTALETTCDPCATAVCGTDPYCCNRTWDQRCIDEAERTCDTECTAKHSADVRWSDARGEGIRMR